MNSDRVIMALSLLASSCATAPFEANWYSASRRSETERLLLLINTTRQMQNIDSITALGGRPVVYEPPLVLGPGDFVLIPFSDLNTNIQTGRICWIPTEIEIATSKSRKNNSTTISLKALPTVLPDVGRECVRSRSEDLGAKVTSTK